MGFGKKIKTTLLLALAAALLLGGTAMGDFEYDFSAQSLEEIIPLFMAGYGLTEDNFAMGWYDLESGESWYYGADAFMVAGSMYKLPLNMAYTDLLASGELQPDDMVGKYTVTRAMELSIIYSDNEAADLLADSLRLPYRDYRLLLAQYSGLDDSELPEEYFTKNRISPRFMINTLVYLYDNSELYSELIGYMKQAHPGRYFKKNEGEYEIAHKYGYYELVLNDCGIVYTPRPFALAAFTNRVKKAEAALSGLCELMTDYSLYLDSLPVPAAAPRPSASPAPAPEPESAPEPEPEPEPEPAPEPSPEAAGTETEPPYAEPMPAETLNPFPVIFAALCALLLALAFVRRRRYRRRKGDRKK